jgi:hypothetical protein
MPIVLLRLPCACGICVCLEKYAQLVSVASELFPLHTTQGYKSCCLDFKSGHFEESCGLLNMAVCLHPSSPPSAHRCRNTQAELAKAEVKCRGGQVISHSRLLPLPVPTTTIPALVSCPLVRREGVAPPLQVGSLALDVGPPSSSRTGGRFSQNRLG